MRVSGLAHSPAAERNRQPIGEILLHWLEPNARVLEIGAGTGQHAAWFHSLLPGVIWQTSDLPENLDVIRVRLSSEAPGLPAPLALDVMAAEDWPDGPWDAVYTANTLHIMPWEHTPALLRGSAERVRPGGLLFIYGPFRDGDRFDAESNRRFHGELGAADPAMGIRDILRVRREAESCGWESAAEITMPANNRIVIFRRQE